MATSDNLSDVKELRVAGSTPPKELAGSIIHLLKDEKRVRLAAIGHQAVGQAVKSIPVVNQYCVAQGFIMAIVPAFSLMEVTNREVDDDESNRMQERTVTLMTLIKIIPQ